jgi:uncharacterized protein YeaO (DUF488 family)
MLKIKRAYEKKAYGDGTRILVDRLWPRGLSKEELAIDEWMKELSPSAGLHEWFGHEPNNFPEFRQKYIKELAEPEKAETLGYIAKKAADKNITLVYSAKDTEHNNAVVLAEYIGNLMK